MQKLESFIILAIIVGKSFSQPLKCTETLPDARAILLKIILSLRSIFCCHVQNEIFINLYLILYLYVCVWTLANFHIKFFVLFFPTISMFLLYTRVLNKQQCAWRASLQLKFFSRFVLLIHPHTELHVGKDSFVSVVCCWMNWNCLPFNIIDGSRQHSYIKMSHLRGFPLQFDEYLMNYVVNIYRCC